MININYAFLPRIQLQSMEKKILIETAHTEEDRKALMKFLISNATGEAAAGRVNLAEEDKMEAQSVNATTIALRKQKFNELLSNEYATAKQKITE
jgi:hypothetical protein